MGLKDFEEIINNFETLYWNIPFEVHNIFPLLTFFFLFSNTVPSCLMFDKQYLVTTKSQCWFFSTQTVWSLVPSSSNFALTP